MRGARSLPLAAGVLSNLRRGGEKAYAAHCICAVHYGKWQLKWVCAIKKFLWGRARIYKQYAARGNANNNVDLPLANFVNFQKKIFPLKKTLNFRFGGEARRYFFRKAYNFFQKNFFY